MGARNKRERRLNLTRKELREHSFNMARLYLPKELDDYLLGIYNEVDFLDTEGHARNFTEEDIWYGLRKPIMEYARIKSQMDDLLADTDYLGNSSMTIRVQGKLSGLLRRPNDDAATPTIQPPESGDSGDAPF